MMKQPRVWTVIRSVAVLLVFVASLAMAGLPGKDKGAKLEKTSDNDVYAPFLINNVFNYYGNNGDGSYNKYSTNNEGFEFYKGTGKTVIFEDGVVWGGFHKGRANPKVGGSVYRHGLQAGKILTYGTASTDPVADDASNPKYRVYRVRPDINPNVAFSSVEAKLNSDEVSLIGRYEPLSAQDIYNQYIKDWNEWPADEGAPYKDVNGDGKYDPTVDIPGQPGSDQTLWYVANDMSDARTENLAGCPPIGIEMQRTIWGYKRAGALGNTIFASSLIINKSGAPIDSMFMVQWADPDLGDAGDDFAGCDTSRSLGYIYNGGASDAIYGTAVPAGGFDFFQGPLVPAPGDSAIFRLQRRYGYRNLPMTTFVFFSQGFAQYADPAQGPNGDVQWYRLMNGLTAPNGVPFVDPVTNQNTKFCLTGDPVKATDGTAGWVDGLAGLTPQDRRICLVTGPFNMAAGDTQELVVANLAGLGADRLSSITVMRSVDDKAQAAYDNLFTIPGPPPEPNVTVTSLDGAIVLSWGDTTTIRKTEGTVDQGFAFEGYNVYEYPPPSVGGNPILLGTYDLKDGIKAIVDTTYDANSGQNIPTVLQMGTDDGIIHSIKITSSKITGSPLVNGSSYYFGVTAYSYNANPPAAAGTHSLEDNPSGASKLCIPHSVDPGTRYPGTYGDTLVNVTHSAGVSDGSVLARIVNPQALTGGTYKVFFATLAGNPVWGVVRTLNGKTDTVARNMTDQTGDAGGALIVDGIEVRVTGAPNDFKDFGVVHNAAGAVSPEQAATINTDYYGYPHAYNDGTPDGTKQQSAGLTASMGWTIATGMNSPSMDPSYEYFVTRVTQSGTRWPLIIPYDFEIRFTAAGGKALVPADFGASRDELIDVPFELWNIGSGTPNDPSDDYQMFPNILDVDGNFQFNLLTKAGTDSVDNGGGGADHTISGGTNDPFTDWIYWVLPENTAPGHAGYDAIVAGVQATIAGGTDDPYLGTGTAGTDVLRRLVLVGWNFGNVDPGTYPIQMPEVGTVFRITSTKPNTPNDAFTIVAPATTQSTDLAKDDVKAINVFPNPYIGFNPQEINKYARFVTFNHLPAKANIRIFNLAGVLIRTIVKDDARTQFAQWDLNNEAGFPVAAGMYVAYIDMPDLGVTKTLKLGIIPEQQYLDRW
jgi:hypothetical protein